MHSTPHARLTLLRLLVCACALAQAGGAAAAEASRGKNVFAEPTPAQRAAQNVPAVGVPAAGPAASWSLSTLQALNSQHAEAPLDLAQAWRLAVLNDPDYQAALSARAAAETERRQGRAAILPQVQAGYSRSRIRGDQTQYSLGRSFTGELDYDATSMYVQLQQPLINIGRYADFKRGAARAELGAAEFREREQATALRLVEVYLEALRAETEWRLAGELAKSLEAQAVAQDRLYEESEGDRIDAQETRSRLALAQADEIRARDARQVALRELEAMVGRPVEAIAGLSSTFHPQQLQPRTQQEWVELAKTTNPAVRVAQEKLRVAETELTRATSRHLPSLDLVGSWAKADSENLDTLSQRTNTWAVGLNASIPIFSGGYDSANRARASAEVQRARQELRVAEEMAMAEATRQYTAITGGEERVRALEAAVTSAEQSLEAAQASYKHGLRSNVDVLRSQDRLHDARRQLADARVMYLDAVAALWAVAGQLNEARLVAATAKQLQNQTATSLQP